MKKEHVFLKCTAYVIMALSIPLLLLINGIQAKKYKALEKEMEAVKEKTVLLIEENKKLNTDISVLASSERIEDKAVNEYGLHKAKTEETYRINVKNGEVE
ncbi:cell division protein FtsL [Treponema sp.]|uniref:cell division protein FtsL n=1 Tax=Treponema sp. TaxID=166 RepID=UPI0025F4F143|nr:cell division protein FtsL [Treponema sp.]MCR5217185.1 cell division protein FtsL [Treponema sp.]